MPHPALMSSRSVLISAIRLYAELVGAGLCSAPTTISEIICAFKSIRAKQINAIENTPGRKRWQRSFYDHVVRTEKEYLQIWTYIDNNPLKWELDRFYESE